MKEKMKNTLMVMFLILFVGIGNSSCSKSDTDNEKNVENTTQEINDSTALLREEVDSLTAQIKELSKNIKEIEDENESNKKNVFIRLGIDIVLLILVIVALIKFGSIKKSLKKLESDNSNQKKLLDQAVLNINWLLGNNTGNNVKSVSKYEIDNLSKKIKDIERKLSNNSSSQSNRQPVRSSKKTVFFETAAKGEGGNGYFRKISSTRDSESSFYAEVIDGKAEFEPIVPLDTLRSIDAMELAVKFEGAPKKTANKIDSIVKGEAQQKGDNWIIVRKAVVTLK